MNSPAIGSCRSSANCRNSERLGSASTGNSASEKQGKTWYLNNPNQFSLRYLNLVNQPGGWFSVLMSSLNLLFAMNFINVLCLIPVAAAGMGHMLVVVYGTLRRCRPQRHRCFLPLWR